MTNPFIKQADWFLNRVWIGTCILLVIISIVPHMIISINNLYPESHLSVKEWSAKMDSLYFAFLKKWWWAFFGIWGLWVNALAVFSLFMNLSEEEEEE